MDVTFFIQGLVIGFTAAAALGPIAVLIIQRTLQRGWVYGVASGVGVALADGLYGLVGGLGLTVITVFLISQQAILRVIGGLVLLYLGGKTLISTAVLQPAREGREDARSLLGAGTTIFFLTLSNAVTILFFAAVYAGLSIQGVERSAADAGLFSLGVMVGSFSWWVILVSGVNVLRQRFKLERLIWLNRLTGVVIAGFGLWVLFGMFSGN
jgi:threonine/homoserine/homoserine lactone efflux protein